MENCIIVQKLKIYIVILGKKLRILLSWPSTFTKAFEMNRRWTPKMGFYSNFVLDPRNLVFKLHLDIVKMHPHDENGVFGCIGSKVIA